MNCTSSGKVDQNHKISFSQAAQRLKAIVREGWHKRTRYSARSASTGFTEAALRAGK